MTIQAGTKLGPYEITGQIGQGGMGTVYKAFDAKLQRSVAIKLLAKQDEDASARLLQEARSASRQRGEWDLWTLELQTGERRLLAEGAIFFDWSPDGRRLVFARSGHVWRVSSEGGQAETITAGIGRPQWSGDGRAVYFRRGQDFWMMSLDTGAERRLTDLAGRRGNPSGALLTDDGQYLYFTWREDLGDIWVMDVVQDGP